MIGCAAAPLRGQTRQPLRLVTPEGHIGIVTAAAFSPDGRWVVTGSTDHTARIWEVATSREVMLLRGHTRGVTAVAFSPDGRSVVTSSLDGTTRVWEAATGQEDTVLRGDTNVVRSAALSPNRRRVVTATNDSTARVWEAATGKEVAVLRGHTGWVNSAAASPDGQWVVTAGGKVARVWNVATRRVVAVFRGHEGWVNSLALSPDGRWVVTASGDGTARVWEAKTGRELAVLRGHTNWVNSAALSADGRWGVTANRDRTARVWQTATGDEVAVLRGHTASVNSAAFSRDGGKVATASGDNTARVWAARTGQQVAVLRGHTAWVNSAAFSSDGQRVVTASGDRTTRVWEAATGRELKVLRAPGNGVVMSAAFSTDDQWVVTASLDGTARVWDVMKGRVVAVLDGHTGVLNSAAFSPDGRWVVTAGGDDTARVWDVGTERQVAVFDKHTAEVKSAAFSPDGARVVTASLDGTARVWEAATGREVTVLRGFTAGVGSAAFSSSDGHLVVTGDTNSVRLWDARTGAELFRRFNVDSSDWAAVAPDGRYDGSQPGFSRLYYAIGLKTMLLTAFTEKFYAPQLTGDLLSGVPYTGPDLRHGFGLPPAVRIVSPHSGDTLSGSVLVIVEARDQGGGVKDVQLSRNGVPLIGGERSGVVGEKCQEGKTADSTTVVCVTVDLPSDTNALEASAYSTARVEAEHARVTVHGPGRPGSKPANGTTDLYLLAVGIDDYQNPSYHLHYARADAAAFADSVRVGGRGIFAHHNIFTLFDTAATGLAIKTTLKRILKSAQPEDAFVFYFAGHGTMLGNDPSQFYLVPSDVTDMQDTTQLAQLALSRSQLRAAFDVVHAAKKFMLVDACRAGAIVDSSLRGPVEDRAMQQLNLGSAVFIVGAAEKDSSAQEVPKLGHGVFTYALLQAMAESVPPERMVAAIVSEVERLLPILSAKYRNGAIQRPIVFRGGGSDWPLIAKTPGGIAPPRRLQSRPGSSRN